MLLVCAFVPQAWLLPLLAAFAVCCLLAACLGRTGAAGYALCLMLGGALGLLAAAGTDAKIAAIQSNYGGRTVYIRAEVESASPSYYSGAVRAVLLIKQADGKAAGFRAECAALPACEAGEYIEGSFAFEPPAQNRLMDSYADGIALEAECLGHFARVGSSGSFRARTGRLRARLSEAVRRLLDADTGGVLAAMVVGDRNFLTGEMNSAYRAAGLSHVLVVSGMHVSILCGDIFPRRGKESSRAGRRARAVLRAFTALILVGVTGFTPSVIRAAVAVWVSSLGVWLGGAPDAPTSLAAAGLLMCLPNGYAVCDVGFELSFAAVAGTLAGAELTRLTGRALAARRSAHAKNRALAKFASNLRELICVSACASAATFPVLVLRGLSASLYALLSSVAVLWLVEPMMYLGLGAAFAGCIGLLWPVHYCLSFCAGALAYVLNSWAVMVAAWPGAQIYFDTAYSALICLLLAALCCIAVRLRVRARVAVPSLLAVFAIAFFAGTALSRDIVRVELVGSSNSPAAVITQNDRAVVLMRGGSSTQLAVEKALERRGVRTVELVADMRLDPAAPCTLEAERTIRACDMAAYAQAKAACGPAELELFRTGSGCAALIEIDGRRLAAVSGSFELAKRVRADWLLAGPADPGAILWGDMLTLSGSYRWLGGGGHATGQTLAIRPGGGARIYRSF